jgi:hypothetical protein
MLIAARDSWEPGRYFMKKKISKGTSEPASEKNADRQSNVMKSRDNISEQAHSTITVAQT